jgi:Protein of unknown function (DUF4232)
MNRPHHGALGAVGLAFAGLLIAACGSGSPGAANTVTVTVTPSTPSASSSTSAASTPTVAPSTSATAAGCLTRYLNGTTGLTQGTAGSVYVVIRFKNLDNVPCTLYGFPGVALARGTPVTDVGQPSVESPTTARELVTLAPGGYANATLQIVDAGNYPPSTCKPVATTWLEVIPPNQTVPLNIPYSTQGCKGSQKLLTVTAVRPGNGG